MMKRILIFALMFLLAIPALGEVGDGALGDMRVVNCKEWVSLREEPSTSAARLARVPLGATVTNCHQYDARFIYCWYNGQAGYILGEYLAPASIEAFAPTGPSEPVEPEEAPEENAASANLALDALVDGIHVIAERSYSGESEFLSVLAVNDAGYPVWSITVSNDYTTELEGTAAFIGGTADDPRVLVYASSDGLRSLRLATGEEVWHLEDRLGGSVTAVVAPDGTIYAGGYYGPNLVAISADGALLWTAAENTEVFWLYELALTDEGIVATYDHIPGDRDGQICYGWDGAVLWMK